MSCLHQEIATPLHVHNVREVKAGGRKALSNDRKSSLIFRGYNGNAGLRYLIFSQVFPSVVNKGENWVHTLLGQHPSLAWQIAERGL